MRPTDILGNLNLLTCHWLPVPQRITFKIALTVYDCARGRCPAYFSDICVPVHPVAGRSRLRSADHGDLIVPRVQTQRYGSRSFRVSRPTVWNSLPQNLRSSDISRERFKRGLRHGCFSVLMCKHDLDMVVSACLCVGGASENFLLKTRYTNSLFD